MSANPEMYLVSSDGVKVGVDVVRGRARASACPAGPILLSAGNGPFQLSAYMNAERARALATLLVAAADRVDGEGTK